MSDNCPKCGCQSERCRAAEIARLKEELLNEKIEVMSESRGVVVKDGVVCGTRRQGDNMSDELRAASEHMLPKRCEGCHGKAVIRVLVTNGALDLCQQCLDDFNRKNPELAILKAEITRLKAENVNLEKALYSYLLDCECPEICLCDNCKRAKAAIAEAKERAS